MVAASNPVETHFHDRLHREEADAFFVSCLFMACDGARLVSEGAFAAKGDDPAGAPALNAVIGGLSANAGFAEAQRCATAPELVDKMRGRLAALRWPRGLAATIDEQAAFAPGLGYERNERAIDEGLDAMIGVDGFIPRIGVAADEALLRIAGVIFADEKIVIDDGAPQRTSLMACFRASTFAGIGGFIGYGSALPTPYLVLVARQGVLLLGGTIAISHALQGGMYDRLMRLFGGAAKPAASAADAALERPDETPEEREKRRRLISEAGLIRYDSEGRIVEITETKLREVEDD